MSEKEFHRAVKVINKYIKDKKVIKKYDGKWKEVTSVYIDSGSCLARTFNVYENNSSEKGKVVL